MEKAVQKIIENMIIEKILEHDQQVLEPLISEVLNKLLSIQNSQQTQSIAKPSNKSHNLSLYSHIGGKNRLHGRVRWL